MEGRGLNIDGEYLSHLICADDIILFPKSPEEFTTLSLTFKGQANQAGLNLHLGNTKVMFKEHAKKCKITVDGETNEELRLIITYT